MAMVNDVDKYDMALEEQLDDIHGYFKMAIESGSSKEELKNNIDKAFVENKAPEYWRDMCYFCLNLKSGTELNENLFKWYSFPDPL